MIAALTMGGAHASMRIAPSVPVESDVPPPATNIPPWTAADVLALIQPYSDSTGSAPMQSPSEIHSKYAAMEQRATERLGVARRLASIILDHVIGAKVKVSHTPGDELVLRSLYGDTELQRGVGVAAWPYVHLVVPRCTPLLLSLLETACQQCGSTTSEMILIELNVCVDKSLVFK
jgi:hypothetical protein